jgi:TatD DNase family protein
MMYHITPSGTINPMVYRLIDSHIHLQTEVFDSDREEVIQRAVQAGVNAFICNGSSPDDWQKVLNLAKTDKRIIPFIGLHPWHVKKHKETDWLKSLQGILERTPCGVGEIGLDRWIKDVDIDVQIQAFREQLHLAQDLNRPVTIHCLRAWGLLLEELRRVAPLSSGFIVHAFGGSKDMVRPLTDMGAYFSFAANVLDPTKKHCQESLLKVPIDRLLIETDSPDIPPPSDHRIAGRTLPDGRYRNEPANLPMILEGVAGIRNEPVEDLAQSLWANAQRLLMGLP